MQISRYLQNWLRYSREPALRKHIIVFSHPLNFEIQIYHTSVYASRPQAGDSGPAARRRTARTGSCCGATRRGRKASRPCVHPVCGTLQRNVFVQEVHSRLYQEKNPSSNFILNRQQLEEIRQFVHYKFSHEICSLA